MEVDLKNLMDKSVITTDDLDYIIERLMEEGICCYELTVAFVDAYKRARTIRDEAHGDKPYFKTDAQCARLISKWISSYINGLEDDSFP